MRRGTLGVDKVEVRCISVLCPSVILSWPEFFRFFRVTSVTYLFIVSSIPLHFRYFYVSVRRIYGIGTVLLRFIRSLSVNDPVSNSNNQRRTEKYSMPNAYRTNKTHEKLIKRKLNGLVTNK